MAKSYIIDIKIVLIKNKEIITIKCEIIELVTKQNSNLSKIKINYQKIVLITITKISSKKLKNTINRKEIKIK